MTDRSKINGCYKPINEYMYMRDHIYINCINVFMRDHVRVLG